ncbi:macro domain-containing protein [Kovacikia minuta CCNUW1]|uniref:macro domain-containing protein n=1 Tax=Kovacikia minuta TaxID=2931930 RepID=UPI001CC9A5BE|nr:macro domain-containing protein [Kovacikia minuta]UBF23949.1 macro domain-containing protein [Kovacikia minuta CCNUW1]
MVDEKAIATDRLSSMQIQKGESKWVTSPNLTRTPKKCFVIMPFGKKDVEGELIDFDEIYRRLIKPTVEALNITCVRCDEIAESGWIHSKMFEHIYESELAVVDITSLNPNVFYELGVRHALVKAVTVLIRKKGTALPYNIQAFQAIEYDLATESTIEEAQEKITALIQNGLRSQKNDSPVHEVLDIVIEGKEKIISKTEVFSYNLYKTRQKKVCLITGDIQNVKGVDVWVNSENTNMQMARYHDRSISSIIRYLGAKKSKTKQVVEDTIANELLDVMAQDTHVPPGTVIVTGAGELERTHQVKKIFHVASVIGQMGKGYTPVCDLGICVRNALSEADNPELEEAQLRSILFPLFGTGGGRGNLEEKSKELIHAAIHYLEENPQAILDEVYFLASTRKALKICQHIFEGISEVVVPVS